MTIPLSAESCTDIPTASTTRSRSPPSTTAPSPRPAPGMDYLAHPANVADHPRPLRLRAGDDRRRHPASRAGGEPAGALAGAGAEDRRQVRARRAGRGARTRWSPSSTAAATERSWQPCKQEYLTQLATAEPRALDIIVADELHACGSTMTALRRLGVEYLRTVSRAGSEQTIWWYRSLLEILDGAVRLAAARDAVRAAGS